MSKKVKSDGKVQRAFAVLFSNLIGQPRDLIDSKLTDQNLRQVNRKTLEAMQTGYVAAYGSPHPLIHDYIQRRIKMSPKSRPPMSVDEALAGL